MGWANAAKIPYFYQVVSEMDKIVKTDKTLIAFQIEKNLLNYQLISFQSDCISFLQTPPQCWRCDSLSMRGALWACVEPWFPSQIHRNQAWRCVFGITARSGGGRRVRSSRSSLATRRVQQWTELLETVSRVKGGGVERFHLHFCPPKALCWMSVSICRREAKCSAKCHPKGPDSGVFLWLWLENWNLHHECTLFLHWVCLRLSGSQIRLSSVTGLLLLQVASGQSALW